MVEIWIEGFDTSGQHADATKLGEYERASFEEAIHAYELEHKIRIDRKDDNYFIWGCKLFTNELEARKSFG